MRVALLSIMTLACAAASGQTFKCTTPAGKIEYRQSACDDARSARPLTGGTTSGIDAMSRRDVEHAHRLEARDRAQAAANVATQAEQARAAVNAGPTDQEIRNLEVSGNSRTIGRKEREFLQGEARRAKAAQADGSYSERDLKQLESAQKAQSNLSSMERERARRDAELVHLRSGSPAVQTQIIMDRQAEEARVNARRAAAARQAQSAIPSTITSCDAGGCWDSSGTRYNRAAGAGNFFRQDGKSCITVADRVQCN